MGRTAEKFERAAPPFVNRKLTRKERRFAREYVVDLNAAAAARRMGFAHARANVMGVLMLQRQVVAYEVKRLLRRQFSLLDLTAERVLEELRRVALADPRALFDDAGRLRPLTELTAEQSACIASMDVVKRNLTGGDGEVETIYRVKCWDKTKALELLAKYFGLLVERGEVDLSEDLVRRLEAGRERARAVIVEGAVVKALPEAATEPA